MNESLRLRVAQMEDAQRVFVWRNDPWIISLSTSQRMVAWEEHLAWFRKVLATDRHLLLLIEIEEGLGIGTVRLDRVDALRATLTVYLLRDFTGQGLGVKAIMSGSARAFAQWPVRSIHAYIRKENVRSCSAFSKAGFVSAHNGADVPPGHVEMVLLDKSPRARQSGSLGQVETGQPRRSGTGSRIPLG